MCSGSLNRGSARGAWPDRDGANQFKRDSVTMYDAILPYDTSDWCFALNASNFTDGIFVDRCSSTSNCFYGSRRLVTRKFCSPRP